MVVWARRRTDPPPAHPANQSGLFHIYDEVIISGTDPDQIAKGIDGSVVQTLHEWVRYDLSSKPIRPPEQRKYETWIGAYLQCSAPVDFEVFFEWERRSGHAGESVTIFLYYDEQRLLADPPPPPAPPPPETSQ